MLTREARVAFGAARASRLLTVDSPLVHPRALIDSFQRTSPFDFVVAAAAFVGLLISPARRFGGSHVDLSVLALSAATSLPLIVRSTFPVAVLILVMSGLLGCLAVFPAQIAAVGIAMVTVFTVGYQGRRLRSLIVGAAMAPVVAIAAAISTHGRAGVGETVARLALILAALAVGDALRGRRALVEVGQQVAERAREAAARRYFDEERLRLARELHDTVAHTLVGINVRAAAAAHSQRNDPGEELAVLEEIKLSSAEALTELRATLKLLRLQTEDAPMAPLQSLEDLPNLVDRVAGTGLRVALRFDAIPARVPTSVSHAAYRIVQESLTNVLRHSDANQAVVTVGFAGGRLTVEIDDDGSEANTETARSGHGIQGMVERATALGGICEAGAKTDGGWHVLAELPTPGTSS